MIESLNSLNGKELDTFWYFYLPKLAKSIKVETHAVTPQGFINGTGFGKPLGQTPWNNRAYNWYSSHSVGGYSLGSKSFILGREVQDFHRTLPMFPKYVTEAVSAMKQKLSSNIHTENPKLTGTHTMEKTMKDTMNSAVDKNKVAISMAAQLSAGKTANSFFLNKLLGKFPWYAKMFSRKNNVQDNPIAKIVAAQTAMVLVTHFAPDNKKLNYITDGMVQEALVDISVNSTVLENMIKELEDIVTLPNFNEK